MENFEMYQAGRGSSYGEGVPKEGKINERHLDFRPWSSGAGKGARGQGGKGGGPHNSSKFDEKIGEGVGIHLRCEKS